VLHTFGDVERKEQDQQTFQQDGRCNELAEMDGGPVAAGGVVLKRNFVRGAACRVRELQHS